MPNQLIFFTTTAISLFFILFMLRLGKEGLTGVIVTNIILVSSFGALLIPLFGLVTNAGNVFYASIFLTGNVLAEHYGRKAAFKSVWVGFSALVLFVLMGQYSIRLVGAPNTEGLAAAMHSVFAAVPRIALASISAYLVSQNLNVWLFDTLHQKTGKKLLWFRTLLSSAVGQLVDSILFFSIAFAGTIPRSELFQSLFTGFGVKMVVAVIGIPFLYLSYFVLNAGSVGGDDHQPGD